MKFLINLIFILFFVRMIAFSQQEHVTVSNSVYSFLSHAEVKGLLPHGSLSYIPLQRIQIADYLRMIRKAEKTLTSSELSMLERFEIEFEIKPRENTVIFYSDKDTAQIFFTGLFSDKEKFIYHYKDSSTTVCFLPLANIGGIYKKENEISRSVSLGNLGFRFYGTLTNHLGYNLQVTNGVKISGDRALALEEKKLRENIKFGVLKSDFDFVESHIRYQNDWFYAIIGRETRFVGSGVMQRLYLSDNAPPLDGISVGARFTNFEYRFDHYSMLAYPDSGKMDVGFLAEIPPKYMSMHTFSYRPSWGEISYIQSIVYSGRPAELAYLTPLSFSKSLEHSLHDRDKTMMGLFGNIRPMKNLQLNGSWMLEDIIISRIGTGYWSNKTAWNIGGKASLPWSIDIGFEYSRIEPYIFTHFNYQNNRTSDGILIGTYLLPNSDETALFLQWFWGQRYPLTLKLAYQRHGDNIYDKDGNIIKNVGGNPRYVLNLPRDSETVVFLDGSRKDFLSLQISGGIEIIRGFNLQGAYTFNTAPNNVSNGFHLTFAFEEF